MTWSEFFYRGGYGFYVWGSYGVALIAMCGEVFVLLRRRASLKSIDRSTEGNNYEDKA
jgi:heme exporter protein D